MTIAYIYFIGDEIGAGDVWAVVHHNKPLVQEQLHNLRYQEDPSEIG